MIIRADETRSTTRLYLITPPAVDPDKFARELEEALAGGDVACLQLRLKEVDDDAIRRATRILQPIALPGGLCLSLADRGAEGVRIVDQTPNPAFGGLVIGEQA